jgi:hypothetical protein
LWEGLRIDLNAGEVAGEVEEAGRALLKALLEHDLEHLEGSLDLGQSLVALPLERGPCRTCGPDSAS